MDDDEVYNDISSDWWLSLDSKTRLLLTCMVHWKNKEIAPLCTGHKRGQNQDALREAKDARVHKEREEEREEQTSQYINDLRMQHQQHLQEDVARMANIKKEIEAIGEKAALLIK
jgi:esterase/lipase